MTEANRKFEILKMARQLVHDEYINKRAEEHNRWVAQNARAIRTTRQGIPYPPFTRHPTEADIVARAQALYEFVADSKVVATTEPALVPLQVPEVVKVPELVIVPAVPAEIELEEPLPNIEEATLATEAEVKEEDHVLPGWIKGWIRNDR